MSVVVKFGGTSVANVTQIQKALAIAKQYIDRGVVLVASAMGKTTDRLTGIIDTCVLGHREIGLTELNQIREEHLAELESITDHRVRLHGVKRIELLCDEMQELCTEVATQKAATDLQSAYILAHGELLATTVIYAMARWQQLKCTLLDSREFIKTDTQPLKAEVDWPATQKQIKECIKMRRNAMYIAQGYIASSQDGRTTTLGRGGSDYSAALIGAALNVESIEIWTDVDGILTTDPQIVRAAMPVNELSYNEAAELSHFGTTVIHPSTMVPAIQKGIPLMVRNINNPTHRGTKIGKQAQGSGVRAIAVKRGITVVNIQSYRMLNAYGFLSRIFAVFADHKKAVDLIATSEISVSLTVDDNKDMSVIVGKLERFAKIEIQSEQGIVSVVAQSFWKDSKAIIRAFTALDTIPIKLVTLGGSDTNLSIVVDKKHISRAVRSLHSVFFEPPPE